VHEQYRELKFLRRLKHANIVALLDDFEEDDALFLVFELLPENGLQVPTQKKKIA
jgi:serine/threonine protein kinase